ncbi:MAG: hypothetical protein GX796_05725 [Clostridiaceae bacterium]|jgi:hypothetical protein|nr:hypothetical protein [Clostridiaceae bacterium]
MKRRIILITVCVAVILCFGGAYIAQQPNTINPNIRAEYFHIGRGEIDEIIEESDLVVKGRIIESKERFKGKIQTKSSEGETVNVVVPYIVYSIEVIDYLKYKNAPQSLDLLLLDAKSEYSPEISKEYVFCLKKNKKNEGSYSITNPTDGLLEFKEDNLIQTLDGVKKYKYKEFKDKFKSQ